MIVPEQAPLLNSTSRWKSTASSSSARPTSLDSRKKSASISTEPSAPPVMVLSSEDSLTKFRLATGINVDRTGQADVDKLRKGPRGIYKEIISAQQKYYYQYVFIESIFYIAIVVQILIGAVLASLGSLSTHHPQTITLLGLVNTSMASMQALLKGQGLPDRLRKNEFEMKKVQDFIEEVETRLAVVNTGILTAADLDEVMEQIFDKYNNARDTAEMNSPTTYARQEYATVKGQPGVSIITGAANEIGGLKQWMKKEIGERNGGNTSMGKGKFVID